MPGSLLIRNRRAAALLRTTIDRMPDLSGESIAVRFQPRLSVSRGALQSRTGVGTPVHAGTDVRRRVMVLESELLCHPRELARIFVHETHHFVWVRLGNPRRFAYDALIRAELDGGATGELGWSAEARKNQLAPSDAAAKSRLWRDYLCESFCDTAAWMYAGLSKHAEWTLPARFRRKRAACIATLLGGRVVRV